MGAREAAESFNRFLERHITPQYVTDLSKQGSKVTIKLRIAKMHQMEIDKL